MGQQAMIHMTSARTAWACSLLILLGAAACKKDTEQDAATPPSAQSQRNKVGDTAMSARARPLARINRDGDFNDFATPRPLVTLEEFFEGNDDLGSIGYNFYPDQPRPAEFYELFKKIRDKPEVADVRIAVMDLEEPDSWPATDNVWIITSASPEEMTAWMGERFRPDDIFDGFPTHYSLEPYDVPEGLRAIGVWWD